MSEANAIQIEHVLACPLCGNGDRKILCTGIEDRLFGAPGRWTIQSCTGCGLAYLDPRPTVRDIGKVYATYYTHTSKRTPGGRMSSLRRYVGRGHLALGLGYDEGVGTLQKLAGYLINLHPEERELSRAKVMYLPAEDGGRVLDVGCGAGETLRDLRALGWKTEGVDFDAVAVKEARNVHDLDVRLGTVEEQCYASNSFDAIILSHVLEHVHDPVALLAECGRILKPGGRLVVATPNTGSLGHAYYGTSWSPLDPPRHLVIFSHKNLVRAAHAAGLAQVRTRTTVRGAYGIAIESHRIREGFTDVAGKPPRSLSEKLRGHVYQYVASLVLRAKPYMGEELLLTATKR